MVTKTKRRGGGGGVKVTRIAGVTLHWACIAKNSSPLSIKTGHLSVSCTHVH